MNDYGQEIGMSYEGYYYIGAYLSESNQSR